LAANFLTEIGVAKPKVGKYSKLSRLKHFSISGEEKISMFYSFNSISKEDYSTGNSSKSIFLDTSAEDKGSLLDKTSGVSRVESCN
jgi:hypothetical protein